MKERIKSNLTVTKKVRTKSYENKSMESIWSGRIQTERKL